MSLPVRPCTWRVAPGHGLVMWLAQQRVQMGYSELLLVAAISQYTQCTCKTGLTVVGTLLSCVPPQSARCKSLTPHERYCPCSAVRDAAVECLEEIYKVIGDQLVDMLSRHTLRPAQLKEIYARLAQHGAAVEASAAGAASPSASEATVGSGRPATLTAAAVAANDSAQGLVPRGGAGKQRPASATAVGYGARRAGGEEGDDASSVSEVGSTRPSTAGMRRGGFMVGVQLHCHIMLPAKCCVMLSGCLLGRAVLWVRATMAATTSGCCMAWQLGAAHGTRPHSTIPCNDPSPPLSCVSVS